MADFSELSDVNSDEMARMLADMDNLDSDLFKDSKKPTASGTPSLRPDGESKRRVLFKDYDGDTHPRASMAEEEKDEEFSPREDKNLSAMNVKSSLMEDLFKIKPSERISPQLTMISKLDSASTSRLTDSKQARSLGNLGDYLSSKSEPAINSVANAHFEKSMTKSKNIFDDDGDILTDLIKDAAKLKTNIKAGNNAKRSFLTEDLFEKKVSSTIPVNRPETQSDHTKIESEGSKDTTRESTSRNSLMAQPNNQTATRPRRARVNSQANRDPLGLLQTDLSSDPIYEPTRLVNRENPRTDVGEPMKESGNAQEGLPEWLGGTKKTDGQKDASAANAELSEKLQTISNSTEKEKVVRDTNDPPTVPQRILNTDLDSENISLFITTQFDKQAAIMRMQQQENELRTGIVLSQQNEQFHKLFEVHRSKLNEQEKQFNALLKLQLERQMLLEKQIRAQQVRIDRYIQVLMTQSIPISASLTNATQTSANDEVSEQQKTSTDEATENRNLVDKLRLEISKLENTLHTLNERHESELTVQSDSYKRQVLFLEESAKKLEKRARQEVEFLDVDYATKLEKLRNEQMQTENSYKEELENLKRQNGRHIEEIYERHSQNIALLRKEHFDTLKNISRAKQAENSAIESVTSRREEIETLLQKVYLIVEYINESKVKINEREEETVKHWENYFKSKEEDLKVEKTDLEKRRNALEEHRSKMISTTEQLEARVSQLLSQLQRNIMRKNEIQETLERTIETLLHERKIFEEKIKCERDHMQMLKESCMAEQERQFKALVEEKEAVAAEKAQLEIRNKLQVGADNVAQIELETAIKAAQKATARANQERLKWQEKNAELGLDRRNLRYKESLLIQRAKELETLTQSALAKKEEGARALKEARLLEDRQKQKFGQLQARFEALIEREKKVAADKFQVARLLSRSPETQKPERDVKRHNFLEETAQTIADFAEIVDPDLVMLKLNLDEQLDTSNRCFDVINT